MTEPARRGARLAVVSALTVIVLGAVLFRVQPRPLLDALAGANALEMTAAVAIALTFNTLQSALAFQSALSAAGAPVSYPVALTATVYNLALHNALPAASGSAGRALYLHRQHGLPLGRVLTAALLLLWLKACWLLTASGIGAFSHETPSWQVALIFGAWLSCLCVAPLAPKLAAWAPGRVRSALARLGELPLGARLPAVALHTFVTVLGEVIVFWILARAVGHPISLVDVGTRLPLVLIGAKLPLTLFGLGTREALAVALLAPIAPAGAILATTLLFSLVTQLLPAVLGSIFTPRLLGRILERHPR